MSQCFEGTCDGQGNGRKTGIYILDFPMDMQINLCLIKLNLTHSPEYIGDYRGLITTFYFIRKF